MKLMRIRKLDLAKVVARGVWRYNGVSLRPGRILATPQFAILVKGRLAGWIGYERRRPGVYEIAHLSVLPRFRRSGLGKRATVRMLAQVRRTGGQVVYARIRRSNYAPQCLLRKLGFRRVKGGRVCKFAKRI
ncbi:MAG: GNAT family N-acetyltransferase [Firmicutes bacterium]|nr:GNAT family N-acetyltransferase [Bacillota bacterium]